MTYTLHLDAFGIVAIESALLLRAGSIKDAIEGGRLSGDTVNILREYRADLEKLITQVQTVSEQPEEVLNG